VIKTFTPARERERAGRIILILGTYHSLLKYSNNGGKTRVISPLAEHVHTAD
jgi:hypothetical protein